MRFLPLIILAVFTLARHAKAVTAIESPERPPKKPKPRPRPRPAPKKPKPRPRPGERPLEINFFVQVSGFEKMFISNADVYEEVDKHIAKAPGRGKEQVIVDDVKGGFWINISWPDSTRKITGTEAKNLIESQSPKLRGRVKQVSVVQ